MLTSSAKAKGRRLCQWLKDALLRRSQLGIDDIRVTSSGAGGEDVSLSPQARTLFPVQFECKNVARFAGYAYYDQATQHGRHTPVVIVKGNHREPLALLKAEDFLDLLQQLQKE